MVKSLFKRKNAVKSCRNREIPAGKNPYLKKILKLKKTIPEWDNFFSEDGLQNMISNWVRLDVLGKPLTDEYAWAIPDEKALKILSAFHPLIEIGAGKGYWSALLEQRGADIVAFDKKVRAGCWTKVQKGGPEVLESKLTEGRNLFLCYPDDSTNLAEKCLKVFTGDYIIHVGELIQTGTISGAPQAPFGRTTGSDFNVFLAEKFHCILSASIPSFPFSKDCITVWKRTRFVRGRDPDLDESFSGSAVREEDEDTDDPAGWWADIPPEERIPVDIAAPCVQHLLSD